MRVKIDKNRFLTFREKMSESVKSILPVAIIILILCFTFSPIDLSNFTSFLIGTVFLIVGVALFTLGAEMSMTPMGEYVGAQMTKSRKIWLIVILSFIVGVMVTMSEPDLQILAEYVPSINETALIISVSCGVGAFLVLAMLRIVFGIKLKYLLRGFYIAVFVHAFFVPKDFLAKSFDAGGVTTGPMTVPFIMALGVGVSSIRSDSEQGNDSFGLVSLCSIGPIVSVLVLGLIFGSEGGATQFDIVHAETSRQLGFTYLQAIPDYIKEVAKSVLPIVLFFLVYQFFTNKMNKTHLARILIGVGYTCVGLILFLTGANVGFMPIGYLIGEVFGNSNYAFLVVPLGMIIGYFIISAEPAVKVLEKQVEDVTSGAIPKKALGFALEIGMAISVGIAMLRAITGISIIYPLIIGYGISLILSFFVPDIFTSIAFDSGGVASGTMTATFLLAFSIGTCEAVGNTVITDAFGMVAMVAMSPLVAIQILGVVYKLKIKNTATTKVSEEVVDFYDTVEYDTAEIQDMQQTSDIPTDIIFDDEIIDF